MERYELEAETRYRLFLMDFANSKLMEGKYGKNLGEVVKIES